MAVISFRPGSAYIVRYQAILEFEGSWFGTATDHHGHNVDRVTPRLNLATGFNFRDIDPIVGLNGVTRHRFR